MHDRRETKVTVPMGKATKTIPPFNPGIFGGDTFHLTTWNIPPPRIFWASKRRGGGSSGCQTFSWIYQDISGGYT